MRRGLLAALLAFGLAWGAGASAQVATDAPGLREIAARLLAAGEAERARGLALALLARDGADVTALLLLGRAELELGDAEAALVAARRAHAEASDGPARFTAARIAAKANADLGRWTRAQVWLRRARQDAPDAESAAAVAQDYRAVTRRNPLAVSLSFGIAPSSNVNGGTSSDTVWAHVPFLGWAPAPAEGDTSALSGLRVSAGAQLSYRVADTERSATTLEAQFSGRTFILSEEALDLKPDAQGSDYSDVTATVGLVQRWREEGASGPSSLSLRVGQTWYDGSPYIRFSQLAFERSFALGEDDVIAVTPLVERTNRLDDNESYWSLGLRGRWVHRLPNADRSNVSLGFRDSLTDLPDVGYNSVTFGTGHDWGRQILGARLSLSTELDWRDYDVSFYAEDTSRQDLTGRLRVVVGLPRYEVYGFYPSLAIEASRTESDASLYDKQALTFDLGFRSSF